MIQSPRNTTNGVNLRWRIIAAVFFVLGSTFSPKAHGEFPQRLSYQHSLASSTFIVGKELTPQPIPFQQHETSAPREVGASVV
jgi:hypothetical protein